MMVDCCLITFPPISPPSKPIKFLHFSCWCSSSSSSSHSFPSWVSLKNKNPSSSSVVAMVVSTSDRAQQQEDNEVEEEEEDDEGSSVQGTYHELPEEETKLFVGNLPSDIDCLKLSQIFKKAGVVVGVEVIYNRKTDKSRGFAFVTMSTIEETQKAIKLFEDYDINGRLLIVRSAAPRGSRPNQLFRPREFKQTFRIYVGYLPFQVDDARLEQIFSEHGKVRDARIVYDQETGRSLGHGSVTMSTQTEVDDAIAALDGQNLGGRTIRVYAAEAEQSRDSKPCHSFK